MSELREAAQAALKVMMEHRTQILLINEVEGRIYYNAIDRLRDALAHPPRDEWRPASEPPDSDRMVLVSSQFVPMPGAPTSLNLAYWNDSKFIRIDGHTAIAYPTHWRDVQPPTEGAAKCQRLESSGQICGLTPPCPDCGPSLIDVPEGS